MPLIVTISEISFGIALADNEIEVSILGDAKGAGGAAGIQLLRAEAVWHSWQCPEAVAFERHEDPILRLFYETVHEGEA
jgi:hypothetical protein